MAMTAQQASTARVGMAASLEQQAHKDAMFVFSEQRQVRREPAAGAELRGGMMVGLHLGNVGGDLWPRRSKERCGRQQRVATGPWRTGRGVTTTSTGRKDKASVRPQEKEDKARNYTRLSQAPAQPGGSVLRVTEIIFLIEIKPIRGFCVKKNFYFSDITI
jgi:hypothetical protein